MAQTSMTVRLDNKQKAIFDELCAQFGMSANTAINIFVKAVIRSKWRKRSIPTHSGWLYPLTFDAGKGLKEA